VTYYPGLIIKYLYLLLVWEPELFEMLFLR
jgi:hypothetical protein